MLTEPKPLHRPPTPDLGGILMERRSETRIPLEGGAMAVLYDDDGAMYLTRVKLTDACATGIGILSPVPAAAGTRIVLTRDGNAPLGQAQGRGRGQVQGIIARCEPREGKFAIGICCGAFAAA